MEYNYFTPAPQPYQFLGFPPTPAHTNGSTSDEISNSPQDALDHFQNFDVFTQFNAQQGLPKQNSSSLNNAPQPPPQNHGYDMNLDINEDANRRGSNSDDEENMTPAQSRRKAQNRAAQRAFRERKERHVKDLEAKLANAEKNSLSVTEENERLKQQLQKANTENEILKATSSHPARGGSEPLSNAGPMTYSPTDFYSEVLVGHDNKSPSHRIVTSSETREKLLAAGATWDYIMNHPSFKRGLVDVGIVSERLKGLAQCDGQGPVFEERAIRDAIEKSVASGSDELL